VTLVRHFRSGDEEAVLGLARRGSEDIDFARDWVFLSEDLRGLLVARPTLFIHHLECQGNRRRATRLLDYGKSFGIARGFTHAIFLIDSSNRAMLQYAADVRAVEELGRCFAVKLL